MRSLAVVLLIGCGAYPYAPVTVTLQDPEFVPALTLRFEKKLNPSCTANCEMGATAPDGGGAYPFVNELNDGGSIHWGPVDVATGTMVTATLDVGNPDPNCQASHELTTAGLEVIVDARYTSSTTATCTISFR